MVNGVMIYEDRQFSFDWWADIPRSAESGEKCGREWMRSPRSPRKNAKPAWQAGFFLLTERGRMKLPGSFRAAGRKVYSDSSAAVAILRCFCSALSCSSVMILSAAVGQTSTQAGRAPGYRKDRT